jgi:hypothetical protein
VLFLKCSKKVFTRIEWEHSKNTSAGSKGMKMLEDVKMAMNRASDTLWCDAVGMAALGVLFLSVLYLPSLLGAV